MRFRSWAATIVMVIALTTAAAATPAAAAEAPTDPRPAPTADAAQRKVSAKVKSRLAGGGSSSFWVMLRDNGDELAAARKAKGRAKAAAVYRDVRAASDRRQAGLRELLNRRKARFR